MGWHRKRLLAVYICILGGRGAGEWGLLRSLVSKESVLCYVCVYICVCVYIYVIFMYILHIYIYMLCVCVCVCVCINIY